MTATEYQVRFLATTNRGLEAVAIEEIESLVGASPVVHHPGMVEFAASAGAVPVLHCWARSLHRVLIERARAEFTSIEGIYDVARGLDVTTLLDPDQSFAVRAQRHGDHEFGSPDVERLVGQAIVDSYRDAEGTRPPVDLDDPSVVFRVLVRHDRVIVALDATGQQSLHRRRYRSVEHDAALRPTLAYAMLHIAGYEGERRLVDPMCGAGTIPIEAALLARGLPPTLQHEPAFIGFPFLNYGPGWRDEVRRTAGGTPGCEPDVVGRDISSRWIDGARENAATAGVDEAIEFRRRDARSDAFEADLVVSDLPFGHRTDRAGLPDLYRSFFEMLSRTGWERLVLLTTRPELVPHQPSECHELRRGRLEATLLVID